MQPKDEPETPSIWTDPRAIALMIAASLTVMTAATISPALPELERQFDPNPMNAFLIRMLVPAPSLAVILMASLCGMAADRLGRRRMLLSGLVLYAIAGSAGLFLPTLPAILLSRLVLGVALAMIMTAQSALLGDYFAGRQLHAVSSGQVSARNLGGFVFILIAGFLATVGPRLPFAIYALPLALLPFFRRVITDPPRREKGVRPSEPSPQNGAGRVLLLLALGQMTATMAFFVMPTQLPFFLAAQGHGSPATTGTALAALMLAGGAAALFYPRIRDAIGNAGVWACGFGMMAIGFATIVTGEALAGIFFGCMAIGAGYALVMPGFVALSLAATSPDRRGKTAALLTSSVFLGQFLSPLVSNPAIAEWGWTASGTGMALAFACAAAASLRAWRRPRAMDA